MGPKLEPKRIKIEDEKEDAKGSFKKIYTATENS